MGCSFFRFEICLLIFKQFILRSNRHEVVERGEILAVSSKKTQSSFFGFYVFFFFLLFVFWFGFFVCLFFISPPVLSVLCTCCILQSLIMVLFAHSCRPHLFRNLFLCLYVCATVVLSAVAEVQGS